MFFPPRPTSLQPLPDFRVEAIVRCTRSLSPRLRCSADDIGLRQSQEDFGFDFGVLGIEPQSHVRPVRLLSTAATFVPCLIAVTSMSCSKCKNTHTGKCPLKSYCERCGCTGHIARACTAKRAYNGNTIECSICGRLTHQAHKCRAVYDCFHQQL